MKNIHPISDDKITTRFDKEALLNQKSKIIWFIGLSGSGKTTLALEVEKQLFNKGFLIQLLDGDNIRNGINSNLGFTGSDRIENIRRISEVSKLFLNCGIICINSFITPTEDMRRLSESIIGKENIIQVYVNTPLDVCEKRDVKGLYKKARAGEIKNFTGITAPFEVPVNPDININTDKSIKETADQIVFRLIPHIIHE